MEEAYKAGKVRAIGVSNFYPDRFLDIQHFAEIKPAVNQVETHVFQQQKIAKEYLKKYGTQIESWGPFAEGKKDYFNNPVLKEIGEKYGKSVAQTEEEMEKIEALDGGESLFFSHYDPKTVEWFMSIV